MDYRIYPPIGIARLGNSPEFFIGSENLNSPGTELGPNNTETPVAEFKDANYRVKRQAARFRIYEFPPDGSPGRPAQLPAGSVVKWTVRLVNKKDAIVRPSGPPPAPAMPKPDPGRANRVIDSGAQVADPAKTVSLGGSYLDVNVALGELQFDGQGNLLVLGGSGVSVSPGNAPIGDEQGGGGFYNNTDWYDDVGDGPVTAKVQLPDGSTVTPSPAWVITTPPDFARASQAVVTLYDVMLQTAINQGMTALPAQPSFARDIQPLIDRASSLRWAHADPTWPQISRDWNLLSKNGAATAQLRQTTQAEIMHVQSVLTQFRVQKWQVDYLQKWAAGNFVSDWPAGIVPATDVSGPSLARAVLDGTAGQGFYPGIEGGIILTSKDIYLNPFDFRLDPAKVLAGDITALMALPWQADFLDCNTSWWPSQRPDLAPQPDGSVAAWSRPLDQHPDHRKMVAIVMRMGVVTPQLIGGQEVAVEEGRDPTL